MCVPISVLHLQPFYCVSHKGVCAPFCAHFIRINFIHVYLFIYLHNYSDE